MVFLVRKHVKKAGIRFKVSGVMILAMDLLLACARILRAKETKMNADATLIYSTLR